VLFMYIAVVLFNPRPLNSASDPAAAAEIEEICADRGDSSVAAPVVVSIRNSRASGVAAYAKLPNPLRVASEMAFRLVRKLPRIGAD